MTSLILCKFSLLSTAKLKLAHTFLQFILRFKIGIFECWLLALLLTFSWFTKRLRIGIFEFCSSWTVQFFPIHEKDEKLGFLNVSLGRTSKFLQIHKSVGKLEYFWISLQKLQNIRKNLRITKRNTINACEKRILKDKLKLLKEHITDKIKEIRGNQIKQIAESISNNNGNDSNDRKIWDVKQRVKRKDETPHALYNKQWSKKNRKQRRKIERT